MKMVRILWSTNFLREYFFCLFVMLSHSWVIYWVAIYQVRQLRGEYFVSRVSCKKHPSESVVFLKEK